MNKKYFQLRYTQRLNQYVLEPLPPSIDLDKIPHEVQKIKSNVWICYDTKKLIKHADILKEELLIKLKQEFELKLKLINERQLVVS